MSWRRRLGRCLAVAGVAALAHALWLPAKALVAQALLHRSWADTRDGAERVKPWPWADTWPVARLSSPGHGSRVVLAGASGAVLAFGPGLLAGSPLPPRSGHTVIAGHRDTHFSFLRRLDAGDVLELETRGQRAVYRVAWTRVVDHRDTRVLEGADGDLTLITCYPFDATSPGGPLRFVVRARGWRDSWPVLH